MALFMKTDKDPDGKLLRVDAGLRHKDGTCFLVLHRLPPEYAKPPTFLARLSGERMELRGEQTRVLHKAYALQGFTPKELKFLIDAPAGKDQLPFFNFSYPTVIKTLGKAFYKMSDEEIAPLVSGDRMWKLIQTGE